VSLSVEEILKATEGRLVQGKRGVFFEGVSTDSRTIREKELFIALRGNRFDGHTYALEALDRRAAGVLIEETRVGDFRWNGYRSQAVIAVRDSLQALGDLARARRRKYGTPLVAITGSNGKTTTKEMVAGCLGTRLPILKTKGNFNNLIGLPLTLLNLTEKEKVVVLELGMNVLGEIRRLTEIAEPDIGLITNIQRVHLEGMGSLERLTKEKGELFRGVKRDGTIVVNRDDPRVVELAKEFPGQKITFGVEGRADVEAKKIELTRTGTSFRLVAGDEETEVVLQAFGRHFVMNALSAVAVASLFKIDLNDVKAALEQFRPYAMRMEIIPLPVGKTLINDTYNANPVSMGLALEVLVAMKGKGRAIALLGDMLELGHFSEEAHRQLGKKISELPIDFLIMLGERGALVVESAVHHGFPAEKVRRVKDHSEALLALNEVAREGDWILIKGSRGMAMEKIAERLKEGRA
jgi:UDP-N-acetylmuramoyl-tripeptide--D-alanyl-D-alanine ligase